MFFASLSTGAGTGLSAAGSGVSTGFGYGLSAVGTGFCTDVSTGFGTGVGTGFGTGVGGFCPEPIFPETLALNEPRTPVVLVEVLVSSGLKFGFSKFLSALVTP